MIVWLVVNVVINMMRAGYLMPFLLPRLRNRSILTLTQFALGVVLYGGALHPAAITAWPVRCSGG